MRFIEAQLKLRGWVVGALSSLAGYAVSHPRRMLVMVALITLAAAPGVRWLKLRTDGQALLARGAPEVIYDEAIRRQFGIEDQLVVLVQSSHPDGVFNSGTLQLVRDLTAEFARMPGIEADMVMSLATEPGFRFRPGTYFIQRLLEPVLTNKTELDRLRDDLRRIELYTGTLVSTDGKCTVILIGTPPGADRAQLFQRISEVIATRQSGREEIAVTGAPVAEALLGIHILEDLGIPKALLGTSTRGGENQARWRMPGSFYDLRLLIARRIGLVPLAMLVMMLILLLSFRNALAMFVPLPGVLATMLFVFGLMGWCGVPVYLTTAVMPVLLTATGVTNDIYLFNRYFRLLLQRPGVPHRELLRETFDRMVSPVASTSLATSIGFFSFGFSPLEPVRAFGLCTGVGVLFSLFYSLTAVPAMLALLSPASLRPGLGVHGQNGPSSPLPVWFARFGLLVVRWRWWVVGSVLLVAALMPLSLRRLVVQDSWIDGFEPNSEFRRVTQRLNQQFYGMHLLLVSFDLPQAITGNVAASEVSPETIVLPGELADNAPLIQGSSMTLSVGEVGAATNTPPGAVWLIPIASAGLIHNHLYVSIGRNEAPTNFWKALSLAGQAHFEIPIHSHHRPEIIRAIRELGTFIRERRAYAIGGVLTPADYLLTTQFMLRPSDPDARRMPEDPAEVKMLWDYYAIGRGQQRLRQVVDTNYWRSLTTVFLKDANFVDTAKLMSDIRAYEREHLAPKGIKIGFAGDVALSQSLVKGIVTTQLQSLFWSVLGIYLLTAFLGGSWRWGVYCVLPSLLAVVIKFALMGWFGIPLGVATSMFAAMTLGIGVNCAIQLLEAYSRAQADGASMQNALRRTMSLTGPPALINTLAVSLGFGVLMLSQVPANARLGLLVVLGLVNCFIVSLVLLPVLLHWWPLKGLRENGRPRVGSQENLLVE